MLKIINIEGTKVKEGNLYSISYSDMVALNQSENHAANKGKMAGRYQFDTHPTGIGLKNVSSSSPMDGGEVQI